MPVFAPSGVWKRCPKANLGKFPTEVLLIIGSYLPEKSLRSLNRASKRLRNLFLESFMRTIIFAGKLEHVLLRLQSFHVIHASSTGPVWSYVRCVRFYLHRQFLGSLAGNLEPNLIGNVLHKLIGLEEVSFYFGDGSYSEELLKVLENETTLWPRFPRLKTTYATMKETETIIQKCPRGALQILTTPVPDDPHSLETWADQLPNLRRLHIESALHSSDRFYFGTAQPSQISRIRSFPQLEWLVLGKTIDIALFDRRTSQNNYLANSKLVSMLKSMPRLIRFAFDLSPETIRRYFSHEAEAIGWSTALACSMARAAWYKEVLQQVLSSVPGLTEVCIVVEPHIKYRGLREAGTTDMVITEEKLQYGQIEPRFPRFLF
ncbi:hypothetical protein FGRMN_1877 [Fusarium graminum]|nr:hypothetical protein FGRMN_1877 [Fusarium graminum]